MSGRGPRSEGRGGVSSRSMAPPDAPGPAGARLEVDPIAVELGERFTAAGFELYLVGGAVRDLLLKVPPRGELDFATSARPRQTVEVLRGWAERHKLAGVLYGTVGAWRGDTAIEITTFRKEIYPRDDRHPVVEFGDDNHRALSRRDFTINAMAVRVPDREFVDPFGGVRHLAAKKLDTPLDP